MNTSAYLALLKDNGISNTKARAIVFTALADADKPLSMNELAMFCKNIDRVSVYRIVEVFETIGLVHRIQYGWKYKIELGDMFHAHHHHMTCLICSSIIEFEEPSNLESQLQEIAQSKNFAIQQHTLELRGICNKCKIAR